MSAKVGKTYICDICPIRAYSEKNPETVGARLWRFHTKFCPMWNSYKLMKGGNIHADPEEKAEIEVSEGTAKEEKAENGGTDWLDVIRKVIRIAGLVMGGVAVMRRLRKRKGKES